MKTPPGTTARQRTITTRKKLTKPRAARYTPWNATTRRKRIRPAPARVRPSGPAAARRNDKGPMVIVGIKPKPSRSKRDVLSLHQDHHWKFLTAADVFATPAACHRTRAEPHRRSERAATRILRNASRAQLAKLPFAATHFVIPAGLNADMQDMDHPFLLMVWLP